MTFCFADTLTLGTCLREHPHTVHSCPDSRTAVIVTTLFIPQEGISFTMSEMRGSISILY